MQEQRLSRNGLQQGLASAPLSESLWSAEAVPAEWPVMELRMSMLAFCSAAGRADSCGDSAPNSFAYPLRAHNPVYVSYVFLHIITGFTRVSALSSSILLYFIFFSNPKDYMRPPPYEHIDCWSRLLLLVEPCSPLLLLVRILTASKPLWSIQSSTSNPSRKCCQFALISGHTWRLSCAQVTVAW